MDLFRFCVTRRVSHVELELLILPEHPSSLPIFSGFVLLDLQFSVYFFVYTTVVVCPFFSFLFAIVLARDAYPSHTPVFTPDFIVGPVLHIVLAFCVVFSLLFIFDLCSAQCYQCLCLVHSQLHFTFSLTPVYSSHTILTNFLKCDIFKNVPILIWRSYGSIFHIIDSFN